ANGVMQSEEKTTLLLNEINADTQKRSPEELLLKNTIDSFKKDNPENNKLLIIKDEIFTSSRYILGKYFKSLRKNIKAKQNNEDMLAKIEKEPGRLLGFDRNHNAYFDNSFGFYVFNKYGILLDAFKHVQEGINPVAISPEGELFYWEKDENEIRFYKIARRW
ncbi:MAG: hypothetical protein JXJ04_10670, partial [Spirochaetales bacterium]|nr:hypothetical protein [Spirochaetales bacterium]